MIDELKPYPEYCSSGDDWLGKVPGHWRFTSLGAISTSMVPRCSAGWTESILPHEMELKAPLQQQDFIGD